MTLDLHPLFVHFPIAFLSFYAVLECVRFKNITQHSWWFFTKALLVIAGTLGALVSLLTGNIAEEQFESGTMEQLIETHSFFAHTATVIFGIVAVMYFLAWIQRAATKNIMLTRMRVIADGPIMIILAIIGFIAILFTGALGAAIVYGPDSDPLVKMITSLVMK